MRFCNRCFHGHDACPRVRAHVWGLDFSNWKANSWELPLLFNEIRALSAIINVAFRHDFKDFRSTNAMTGVLAKQGVERTNPWKGFIM